MSRLTLTSLGGAGTVTGSKHLLECDGRRILVDCGLFQGLKPLRLQNWQPLPIDAGSIDAVVLTHAHLDHCGYLPRLLKEGFRGPIHCTAPTADLVELLLLDSAKIQESDAEFANRHGFSKHTPALPLYTKEDAKRAVRRLTTHPFHAPVEIGHGATVTFRHAGHILGAATVQLDWGGRTGVFSGDLGRYDDPVTLDPEAVAAADYLLVESTYGDRKHDPMPAEDLLADIVETTARRGGTVVVPAFAVGRAQSLLYHFWKLKREGRMPLVPVYLDSPMAISATDILTRNIKDIRLGADEVKASCEGVTYVRNVLESKALSHNSMPKVIISASGMATGGRVLHHLKAFGPDRRNTILFSGYQAAGTRGADLIAGKSEVKIHGHWVAIRAEIRDLPMLSAHADADEIMRWLGGFESPPRRTFIIHGEPEASLALKTRIEAELHWACTIPAMGEEHVLA